LWQTLENAETHHFVDGWLSGLEFLDVDSDFLQPLRDHFVHPRVINFLNFRFQKFVLSSFRDEALQDGFKMLPFLVLRPLLSFRILVSFDQHSQIVL
jgi:hypothetical protein